MMQYYRIVWGMEVQPGIVVLLLVFVGTVEIKARLSGDPYENCGS